MFNDSMDFTIEDVQATLETENSRERVEVPAGEYVCEIKSPLPDVRQDSKGHNKILMPIEITGSLNDEFDGELFNIGADKYFTLNQVAETVQAIGHKYGYNVPIEHGEPRHEVKHAYCDHTKAKTLLQFRDGTILEELIEDMFVWAMKEPNRKVKDIEYEITEGIYDYWKN